jgi:O-antigen ligase
MLPPHSAIFEKGAPWSPAYALIRTSLIATLLAAPLAFGAVQEWAWGALAVVAFLLLLFWSIAGARQGGMRIFWSPLYLPAGLFFLLGMIQFAGHLTMDPIATRESLLKLSTDLILFFLAGQLFSAPASAREPFAERWARGGTQHRGGTGSDILSAPGLRWTLVVYTFVVALFAIFQFFSSDGLIYWMVEGPGWTFGPYVNHNHYAGLMEMLIPLMVASLLPALRRGASEVLLGFVVLIPIASLLLSGSRGGFISLVVEVLLAAVLVFLWGPRRARQATALVGGAAILAAALLFFWMAPSQIAERLARMGDGTQPPEVELGGRLVVAKDSLGILRDHPWLGTGLGSFETVYPRYQSLPTDFRWDHAHNDYAEALAETGLAGGALILCALGLFFWLAFKEVVSRRFSVVSRSFRTSDSRLRTSDPHSRAYRLLPTAYFRFAAALGCCGLLVHSFMDFNLHIPANAAWFAVCAAIATSPTVGAIS